jgi:hypothetical protein
VTSNREPMKWVGQMADALLAQSAIDRLQSAAYELVLDGKSYRKRQNPGPDVGRTVPRSPRRKRRLDRASDSSHHRHADAGIPEMWSLHIDGRVVSSTWRATLVG